MTFLRPFLASSVCALVVVAAITATPQTRTIYISASDKQGAACRRAGV